MDAKARAVVNPTAAQERMYMDESLNEVVEVDNAVEVAKAFSDLCLAAWTPNQSEEREANTAIAAAAMAVLNAI